MNGLKIKVTSRRWWLLCGLISTTLITTQQTPAQQSVQQSMSLPAIANPFEEIKSATNQGTRRDLSFTRTSLDTRATASAEVVVRGQTLLVRMQARNMPLPSQFGVPRYALWVYVPNYQVKMYIGDLPITPSSGTRGTSDSAVSKPYPSSSAAE